ncbi:unnamed protein product [Cunninghamella blakesleeana]
MNHIYEKALFILAVLDLHKEYLLENTANKEIMNLIYKYRKSIYKEMFDIMHPSTNGYINNDDVISSTIANSIQRQQNTNNDDQYSFMQKLNNNEMINEVEELIKKTKQLKIENEALGIEGMENGRDQKKSELKKYINF